jgi:Berberine and berberine like
VRSGIESADAGGGSYMSEADSDNPDWKIDWYGVNYDRLLGVKQAYGCEIFFYADKVVGSGYWSVAADGRM